MCQAIEYQERLPTVGYANAISIRHILISLTGPIIAAKRMLDRLEQKKYISDSSLLRDP